MWFACWDHVLLMAPSGSSKCFHPFDWTCVIVTTLFKAPSSKVWIRYAPVFACLIVYQQMHQLMAMCPRRIIQGSLMTHWLRYRVHDWLIRPRTSRVSHQPTHFVSSSGHRVQEFFWGGSTWTSASIGMLAWLPQSPNITLKCINLTFWGFMIDNKSSFLLNILMCKFNFFGISWFLHVLTCYVQSE